MVPPEMTAPIRNDVAIPRWVPVLLAVVAIGTWSSAALFLVSGSLPIGLVCAALAFLLSYVTLWLVALRSRFRRAQNGAVADQMFRFMPFVSAGAAGTLVVAAALSLGRDYGLAFFGLCVLGAVLLGAWTVWAPIEARRIRRRFGLTEDSIH